MKTQFKYLLSNLLLIGLTGTMFATTGCPSDECTTDADCAEGEVCNTETSACETPTPSGCAKDSDCTVEGERCLDITDGTGTCRAPANCREQADPDGFCNAMTAGQVCRDMMCVTPAPTTEFRYILIKDVSTGEAACKSTAGVPRKPDPGSDIMWASLDNADGEEIGFGKAVKFVQGTTQTTEPNGYPNATTVLSGSMPTLDNNGCPSGDGDNNRFNPNTVVSLGCGGELFVEFIGTNNMVVLIENGFAVSVGEYAQFCNAAGGDAMGSDRYEVYLCETNIGAMPESSNCTVKLTAMPLGGIMAPVKVNIN
jgi:Cys-rich repeat protein